MSASGHITVVDLFSGAGGLSLGWRRAAPSLVNVIAAVDSDASLLPLFEANHPGTGFLRHEFGEPGKQIEAEALSRNLELQAGDIDVLLAGPPCQPFSAAGKRTPGDDGMLVFHVCDIASHLKPRIVLIENVPEFSRVQDGRLLGRLRVAFHSAGFKTDVRVLRADSFGVPQTRTRCFMVAIREDVRAPVRPLVDLVQATHVAYESKPANNVNGSLQRNFYESLLPTVTVEEAIGDLPALAASEGNPISRYSTVPFSSYQRELWNSEGTLFNHVAVSHSAKLIDAIARLKIGETPQRYDDHPLRPKEYFRAAYARLDPHAPAPTITTQTHNPGSGRFTHYRDHRVITVREAARLQGFPDEFQFFGTQEAQRRHVGNAVPPLMAEALAKNLLHLLT